MIFYYVLKITLGDYLLFHMVGKNKVLFTPFLESRVVRKVLSFIFSPPKKVVKKFFSCSFTHGPS